MAPERFGSRFPSSCLRDGQCDDTGASSESMGWDLRWRRFITETAFDRDAAQPRRKSRVLHGRFRLCETPEEKLPASDLQLRERFSSSTGKLQKKPAFYVTEKARQTPLRLLAVRVGSKSVRLHLFGFSQGNRCPVTAADIVQVATEVSSIVLSAL